MAINILKKGKQMMEFIRTGVGRGFFGGQIPSIVKSLSTIANAAIVYAENREKLMEKTELEIELLKKRIKANRKQAVRKMI